MILEIGQVLRQLTIAASKDFRIRTKCTLCLSSHRNVGLQGQGLVPAAIGYKNSRRWISQTGSMCKRPKPKEAEAGAAAATEPPKKNRPPCIPIWKNMTVQELANSLGKPIDTVFEAMLYVKNADVYDSPKSAIDDMVISRDIAKRCGFRTIVSAPIDHSKTDNARTAKIENLDLQPRPISEGDLAPREPVVTIMGHVDHGKTTLLDFLRSSDIAGGEAGGITQHIGAFRVPIGKRHVTFLDTPGHAAFSSLRNRGAQATDIVILVVAADDGVMEQTKESIRMAREANVPIVVAINKIDKSNADIERTKSMLLQEGIQLEDFGGDVQAVAISALKGTNIPILLDTLLLQAELLNLRSEIRGRVEGVVLESSVDPGRGKLSTALIQRGVLRKSAVLVAGTAWAKVRGIFNEHGETLHEATPSMPVQIIGWREIPSAGDRIFEVDSEHKAKQVIEYRESLRMNEKQEEDLVAIHAKLEVHNKDYKAHLAERLRLKRVRLRRKGPRAKEVIEDSDPTPKLYVLLKGDVDGSVESFLDLLDSYDCQTQCRLDVVHYGLGDISENDVKLAELFGAHVYAFNVSIPDGLHRTCTQVGIKCRQSRVIYRLVEELKKDIEAILPKKDVEEELGTANVLQIFEVTDGKKKIAVAGSRCTKGLLRKDSKFKLLRGPENEVIHNGKVSSIRHLKNEVDSIKNGVECGIAFTDGSVEPAPGDTLVCYRMIQVTQKCEWDPGF